MIKEDYDQANENIRNSLVIRDLEVKNQLKIAVKEFLRAIGAT